MGSGGGPRTSMDPLQAPGGLRAFPAASHVPSVPLSALCLRGCTAPQGQAPNPGWGLLASSAWVRSHQLPPASSTRGNGSTGAGGVGERSPVPPQILLGLREGSECLPLPLTVLQCRRQSHAYVRAPQLRTGSDPRLRPPHEHRTGSPQGCRLAPTAPHRTRQSPPTRPSLLAPGRV
ncbi:hypothetical protein NDU88_002461 [Pleurodeles waltl]|uniref:Uncharacterized protein n=1 Tax=Pleurodeles waltl TaxID=8319 RepID=A0AAV7VB94_PLEWA|nr:hypothetical protein NDU88_002461 [Pleurodeles waltl]